jgi:hypothetical protein
MLSAKVYGILNKEDDQLFEAGLQIIFNHMWQGVIRVQNI